MRFSTFLWMCLAITPQFHHVSAFSPLAPIWTADKRSSSFSELYAFGKLRAENDRMSLTNPKNDGRSELDRLKYKLNGMKEKVLGSEMRATAAERKVQLLKEQLEEAQKEEGQQKDQSSPEMIEQMKQESQSLLEQVQQLTAQLNTAQDESKQKLHVIESAANEEKKQLKTQMERIETEWKQAQFDLEKEKERSVDDMAKMKSKLTHEHEITLKQAEQEMRRVQMTVKEKIQFSEQVTQYEKDKLAKEVEKLNAKLDAGQSRAQFLSANLISTKASLIHAQIIMNQQLIEGLNSNIIRDHEINVMSHERERLLVERNQVIQEYMKERSSLRKLFSQALRLTKSRVGRVVRVFRRDKNQKSTYMAQVTKKQENESKQSLFDETEEITTKSSTLVAARRRNV
eukprot:scaffold33102_cov50-Attheya_sp.AAC.3